MVRIAPGRHISAMPLAPGTYDLIERAIVDGTRLSIMRRGTEYIVVPLALRHEGRRELIDARHPTTGEVMSFALDELDRVEAIRR